MMAKVEWPEGDSTLIKPNTPEPPPEPNASTPIWNLVISDMHERDRIGTEKYGTPLQAHNGRDALVDAYQEALDLVVYLRQEIEERKPNLITYDLNGASLTAPDVVDLFQQLDIPMPDGHICINGCFIGLGHNRDQDVSTD